MLSKFNFPSRAHKRPGALSSTFMTALSATALIGFCSALPLFAQSDQPPAWGTTAAPTGSPVHGKVVLGTIEPGTVELMDSNGAPSVGDASYKSASYATGGAALRNRASASLSISGAVTPIKAAFLYWAVITEGNPPSSDAELTLTREYPGSASSTLTGTAIGSGSSPCWTGNKITVYRATVPASLASGNGAYRVTISSAAGTAGTTNGSDPWTTIKDPLWEGASLVIVGTGTGTVAIYDSGLAGFTWKSASGVSYTLTLPATATGKLTLWDSIGADGQVGTSRLAVSGDAQETTKINGKNVAGDESVFNDSDWNGSSGYPLPQLWDDVGHNITSLTPSGTKSLDVEIANFYVSSSNEDCLTTVANVVEVQ